MAHRKRVGYTQEQLAEQAGVSIDTISKIEIGATGARFPMIEKIAAALEVDPAELFSPEIPSGALRRGPLLQITTRLASLSESELRWISGVIDAVLRNKA
jgi:transcriptional regulator with XRE-family HTH domain